MSVPYLITRTRLARPDGARRWDRAYQLLLQWGNQQSMGANCAPITTQKEYQDERRLLCAGLDPSSTNHPHD
jgi:hypothetical protein